MRNRIIAAGIGLLAAGGIVYGGVAASASTTSPTAAALFHREAVIRTDADNSLAATTLRRELSVLAQGKAYTDSKVAALAPTVTPLDVAGTTLPHIGGSWGAGHVALGSQQLPAGTYLVAVTGDFYKAATTDATPVLQIQVNGLLTQITAYTGAFPANAAEGVGLGSDGTPNGLEQTASAYATVVVPDGATAEVDAFGYNPDRSGSGAGDFGVIAHATFTKIG